MTSSTLRERLNISRIALRHPRATYVAWALVALLGIVAWTRLRVALFPDITFPVIVITADRPGASLETMERDVTLPLERVVRPLADLKTLRSGSSTGRSWLAADFEVGLTLDEAERRVRGALPAAGLPEGTATSVHRVDLNETPVVTYVLVGKHRTPPQLMGTALGTSSRHCAPCRTWSASCRSAWIPRPYRDSPVRRWTRRSHSRLYASTAGPAWRSRWSSAQGRTRCTWHVPPTRWCAGCSPTRRT
jgi:hypothetical protein